MAFLSPRMSLKVWNSAQDPYSHEQLADNFLRLDQHDHAQGRGTQIGGDGIKDGSIEARHIFPGTLSPALVSTELDTRYLPAIVTSLPGSPTDGQEIYYVANTTNGVIWHLRYRSASASIYKWEFVGGPPLYSETLVQDDIVATGSTFVDASGPNLTVPLSGEYLISFTVEYSCATTLAIPTASLSVVAKWPALAANLDNGTQIQTRTPSVSGGSGRTNMKRTLSSTNTLKLQYMSGAQTWSVWGRNLSILPVRVI